jgi:sugar phosphate isomerase/epimerase
MQFGYSTLANPEASLSEAATLAAEFGLTFVEVRSLGNTLDLPGYFRAHPGDSIIDSTIQVAGLGTSLVLTRAQPSDVETFLKFGELAVRLGASFLRVFGGGEPDVLQSPDALAHAAKIVRSAREGLGRRNLQVDVLLETHDGFCSSASCLALNRLLDQPLGILWDSHHTWKFVGETLEHTWAQLGPLIRHVHYKDSVVDPSSKSGFTYALPGEGEFPTTKLVELLAAHDFQGGVSLEWERLWQPQLAPAAEPLRGFRKVLIQHGLQKV